MNFLRTIRDSIYSPSFYFGIPKKPFKSAIGYFFLLILILTIIQSILPIRIFLTTGQTEIKTFVDRVKNFYPAELEVKIENGKASTNVPEPYFIPSPFNVDDKTVKSNPNLIVIDTKTPFSIEQFNQYKTYVWLTEDSIVSNNKGQIQINDLSGTPNATINKTLVTGLIDKFSPWLNLITPIVVIGLLIIFYIAYSFRLIYLFFLAFLIWLLTKLVNKPLPYWTSFKIGLYAMTLGLFVSLILNLIDVEGFSYMFTIISLAVVLINLSSTQKVKAK
jgi:hypothetical protein